MWHWKTLCPPCATVTWHKIKSRVLRLKWEDKFIFLYLTKLIVHNIFWDLDTQLPNFCFFVFCFSLALKFAVDSEFGEVCFQTLHPSLCHTEIFQPVSWKIITKLSSSGPCPGLRLDGLSQCDHCDHSQVLI